MSNHLNFNKTMEAAESFYENSMHNFAAKMLDNNGFTARLDFDNKQYWSVSRIDKDAEIVIMEISPSIICLPEARSQLGEYIQLINNKYKVGNIRISANNSVYIHTEQRFDDAPIISSMFQLMEGTCVKILDTFYAPLSKLANCKLITAEEADVDTVISKYNEEIESKLRKLGAKVDSLFGSLDRKSENTDNDDDDDLVLSEPPGFPEWLKRKRKKLEDKASLHDNTTDTDKSEYSDSSENNGLLDVLLGLPEDETIEEVETSLDIPESDDSDKSSDD